VFQRDLLVAFVFVLSIGKMEVSIGEIRVEFDTLFQRNDGFLKLIAHQQRVTFYVMALAVAGVRLIGCIDVMHCSVNLA